MPSLSGLSKALSTYLKVIAVAIVLAIIYRSARGPMILAIVTTLGAVALMAGKNLRVPTRNQPRQREGWNLLGNLEVRSADPFVTFRADESDEGITIPVSPGGWTVHARAAEPARSGGDGGTTVGPPGPEVEVRVVRDVRWAILDWEWSPLREPVIPESVGTASQVGRLGTATGVLRIHAGRKDRGRGTVRVQTQGVDGSAGIGVVRDLGDEIVALASRFG